MSKKAAVIILVLVVAFVGALGWAVLTLSSTRDQLLATTTQLEVTRGSLEDTRSELTSANNELTGTKSELTSTRSELTNAKSELTSTRNELTNAKSELTSTRNELTSTRSKLTSTEKELTSLQDQLSRTQQQLAVAQETLKGLVGITLSTSKECYDVALIDNPRATNSTWSQLMAFLSQDQTERHTYIKDVYDCSQFSRDVHNNAEAAGIRAAEVQIHFMNEVAGHALNVFLTTDYGLVYVDCTEAPDKIARVKTGKEHRAVELYRITRANIRDDYWWDTLDSYFYISSSTGGKKVVSGIRIYW